MTIKATPVQLWNIRQLGTGLGISPKELGNILADTYGISIEQLSYEQAEHVTCALENQIKIQKSRPIRSIIFGKTSLMKNFISKFKQGLKAV